MNEADRIKHLTELYFAGETTLEQERELRRLTSEASAVQAWARMNPPTRRRRISLRAALGAAAAVAVVAVIGARILIHDTQPSHTAVIYADGLTIHSEEASMELFNQTMADLSEAGKVIDIEFKNLLTPMP